MLAIDAATTALGILALAASPLVRYMFAVFLVVTVCGFAFGARAGFVATPQWQYKVLAIVSSALLWFVLAWAALIWWLNRYGS
jgi:hypothetical protein